MVFAFSTAKFPVTAKLSIELFFTDAFTLNFLKFSFPTISTFKSPRKTLFTFKLSTETAAVG